MKSNSKNSKSGKKLSSGVFWLIASRGVMILGIIFCLLSIKPEVFYVPCLSRVRYCPPGSAQGAHWFVSCRINADLIRLAAIYSLISIGLFFCSFGKPVYLKLKKNC